MNDQPNRTAARTEAERRHKLRRIRAKVRRGSYENALKLSIAIDRMLKRIKN